MDRMLKKIICPGKLCVAGTYLAVRQSRHTSGSRCEPASSLFLAYPHFFGPWPGDTALLG